MALPDSSALDPERDLDAWLGADPAWDDEAAWDEPIAPADLAMVNALFRRHRRLGLDRQQYEEQARAEIERINEWLEKRVDGLRRQQAWCEESIETFARRQYAETGKPTLDTVNGRTRLTKPTPRVVVTDEEAAIAWLKELLPEAVKVEQTVRKQELKSRTEPDDYVDGVFSGEPVEVTQLLYRAIAAYPNQPTAMPVPGVSLVRATERSFSMEAK